MSPEEVPDVLVEKAARAIHKARCLPDCRVQRQHTEENQARHALAAVLPEIQAQALEEARKRLQHAFKTEVPRALLGDGQQSAWRIGISRAHRIVRDYQRSLATTKEPS